MNNNKGFIKTEVLIALLALPMLFIVVYYNPGASLKKIQTANVIDGVEDPAPDSTSSPQAEVPTCVDPQVLVDNVCTDPAPTPAPDSTSSPQAEVPTCVAPQVLVNNVCTTPTPPVVNSQTAVRSIYSPITKGTFHSGIIPIVVTFNRAVVVSGTPQLILSTGTPSTTAVPKAFAFGNRLYFLYHIISGNSSTALDYSSSSAIDLNGGSIKDLSGQNVDITLPEPGSSSSLSGRSKIVIETPLNEI